jgi:integrase
VTLLWSKVDLRAGTAEVHTKGDVWHRFPLTQRMKMIIANRPKVGPFVFTYVCRRPAPAREGRPRRLRGERYPFSKQGWDRRWREILASAGVTNFRFHDLRHTAGSRITRVGGIRAAQKLLGHTNITTTTRYAHVTEADILSAMENAEQSRNSPEQTNQQTPENGGNLRSTG